ncbi:TetR/AcrR family transcriptional regulator [Parasphingorhabdus cellanae]|uniref:TetR/AcrR family transcriptional regulator n=1 Tax=Parasphingorhabdus cellanae TaxID=2806553 RepID=A0ABX7T6V7_9SPHN|nr:TetR/AcrR family transcriptional regulator [Parasphingorhabdus cellanae]QTD57334.1 TetR/AcrR family transcriptional regulator [Parasphingorhabdus cellanae]
MNKNPVGRPKKGQESVTRSDIVTAGLDILKTGGERSLTMRGLAKSLSVTPMALYHHTGNREELIQVLADAVYDNVLDNLPKDDSPFERIQALLMAYCERVAIFPELTLCIFREPSAFAGQVKRITESLHGELVATKLPAKSINIWLDVLVDYTHGHALAQSVQTSSDTAGSMTTGDYQAGVRLLLRLLTAQIEAEQKNDL